MELKTAIIVDPMGSMFGERTLEDEIKQHIEDFSELLAPAKLKVYTPYSCYPGDIQPGTELVLFDYGGMLPGTDMAEKNSWHLVTWAADNPNALVVVVSVFTYGGVIEHELEQRGMTSMHNIVPRHWTPKIEDFDTPREHQPEGWECIPQWFRDMYHLPKIDPYAKMPKKLKKPKRQGK